MLAMNTDLITKIGMGEVSTGVSFLLCNLAYLCNFVLKCLEEVTVYSYFCPYLYLHTLHTNNHLTSPP